MNLYALHEWNTKRQRWSVDLDTQATVCLAREVSDNQNKFVRWTVQSLLAGVEKMRFAFIQRLSEKTPDKHKVVGTQTMTTEAFAQQINLQMKNCWAIVDDIANTINAQTDKVGEYLFMREVSSANYRLIKKDLPEIDETGEEEEEEEYEDEEDKEEESKIAV